MDSFKISYNSDSRDRKEMDFQQQLYLIYFDLKIDDVLSKPMKTAEPGVFKN